MREGHRLQRRYIIVRALGRGGMGTTYLARDVVRQGIVALKLVDRGAPELLSAFRSEFEVLCGLLHPNLCEVLDFGYALSDDGQNSCFYTARYIEGRTLDQVASGQRWEEIKGAVLDAVEALHFLHELGVRHGDFKPQNVLVDREGRGVVIDLGCSRPIDTATEGIIAGTPAFLAPELLCGGSADHRADLYALGVTLDHLSERLLGGLPEPIHRLVARLRSDEVGSRPADAVEVLEALGATSKPVGAPGGHAPKLVGREREMTLFTDLLDHLLDDRAGLRALYVTGSEGVGRTRQLREMKWCAQLRCQVVEVNGRSDAPITEALGRAAGDDALPLGLEGIFRARELTAKSKEAVVLFVDDAHLLPDDDHDLLHALLRTVEERDRLAVVCSANEAPTELSSSALDIVPLAPLSVDAVAEWAAGIVSPSRVPDLLRLSGGYPSSVRSLLAGLSSGEWTEEAMGDVAGATPLSEARIARLEALSAEEQRAVALFAARSGQLGPEELARLDVSAHELWRLLSKGWVQRDGSTWRLVRCGEAPRILGALGRVASRHAHVAIADSLERQLSEANGDERRRSENSADRCVHLALAEEREAAEALLLVSQPLWELKSAHWSKAAEVIARSGAAAEALVAAAEILELAGHPDRALEPLELVLKAAHRDESSPADDELIRDANRRIGACLLKLGDSDRAVEHLQRAALADADSTSRARTADMIARSYIKRGDYTEALSCAREALSWPSEGAVVADLHDVVGVAASYLGDLETARTHLAEAAALHIAADHPRALIRSHSYQALTEYRAGNARAAAEGYRRSLEIAEAHGLSDEISAAALNLGTACHQQGDLGAALASYERGLPIAAALGKLSTEATLRLNLAKIYFDIGLLDRAESAALRAKETAAAAKLRLLLAVLDTVAGEIARARGDLGAARSAFERARSAFIDDSAAREAVETDLDLLEVHLAAGDLDAAQGAYDLAVPAVRSLEADDLSARITAARGSLCAARGDGAKAMTLLEEAAQLAKGVEQRSLEADIEATLATLCEQQGAALLSTRHNQRAREIWERIGATLPPHMREAFWLHPRRVNLDQLDPGAPPAPADLTSSIQRVSDREGRLEKLLEINRRLNSSLKTDEVLSLAMDAAIEITGAERGFLILAKDFEVAVARNIDRERIGRSHLKFSKSIAEQVIATATPVVTVDAQSDRRFSDQTSIHDMQLKSVVSVPIIAPDGILGALYLDNRFQRGRFEEEHLETMLAFADQVAIALTNARLVDELERRTRELEAERRRVEELARGQARQIDQLLEEVRTKQQVLEHRYDYSNIIGQSASMQAVFDLLDRVIDSTATVMIQGESGTGKELIARSIHFNGPNRSGPFVAVNCAAFPETLLESELFGHVRGAFTGADRDRVGLLASAGTGSLFLDELGEMPLGMQAKLLRVLEQRVVRPLGSSRSVPIECRLICATNRSLRDEVAAGRFREDLFYRLGVVELTLPPLRERSEDIPLLATAAVDRVAKEQGRPASRLSNDALRKLLGYSWPGNVRQLENVVTKALLLGESGELLPTDIDLPSTPPIGARSSDRGEFQEEEKERILAALRASRWNVSVVSRNLGIPRATLYRKMSRYGLSRKSR